MSRTRLSFPLSVFKTMRRIKSWKRFLIKRYYEFIFKNKKKKRFFLSNVRNTTLQMSVLAIGRTYIFLALIRPCVQRSNTKYTGVNRTHIWNRPRRKNYILLLFCFFFASITRYATEFVVRIPKTILHNVKLRNYTRRYRLPSHITNFFVRETFG